MPDDAVSAVAELAASQHRAFTRRQAAEVKFDHRRIATAKRHGWLEEPYPGVLVIVGSEAGWHQRLMAATLADGGHAVASHRAAARLHALDGFTECNLVEVSVTNGHRWRRKGEVVAHHVASLDAADIVTIDGIRSTGLARTLSDLGAVVEPMQVRRALTDARRRGTSLRWIQLTADRLHRPGPTGASVLLEQLAAIPAEGRVSDSWFEELIALCLDDPEIPPIELQCPIRDESGRVVAHADIGIPSVRLGLEAHSRQFHFGPDAEPLDEQRDLAAGTCGWDLQYLGWYAARRPKEVLAVVKKLIAVRRRQL
jgi:hypothetical protein